MSNFFSQNIHNYIKKIIYNVPYIEQSSSLIIEALQSKQPIMVARFGSVEIKAVLYPNLPWIFKAIFQQKIFRPMQINAGFFPVTVKNIQKFSDLMLEDMKELDILGSWRIEERLLSDRIKKSEKVKLDALEPYLQNNPWSEVLKNKNILVIHPFNKTIESQYHNKRTLLFKDKRVLPEFKSLQTIKAIQTIAGNNNNYSNWFEALDYMKMEINKKEFDIAIIGCGAYGFPLTAHVKRMGKKAVHLGGATQILFGIKGKRWIDNPKFETIINEHFVFPGEEDKPKNSEQVEGGCYW